MGGCLTIAARDGEEVLIANFSQKTTAWAVKTQDPAWSWWRQSTSGMTS
jgi:hypothetical protein